MKCKVCGKDFNPEKMLFAKLHLCSEECFTTDFWLEKVRQKDDPNQVIIEGECYYIGEENCARSFRGFGGHEFIIKRNDGKLIKTTNLWYNGEIPPAFRFLLPDNATFIEK